MWIVGLTSQMRLAPPLPMGAPAAVQDLFFMVLFERSGHLISAKYHGYSPSKKTGILSRILNRYAKGY